LATRTVPDPDVGGEVIRKIGANQYRDAQK